MRGGAWGASRFGLIAAMAAASIGVGGAAITGFDMGSTPAILGRSGADEAERRRRNLAAGGRDKRIARAKARPSFARRRRNVGSTSARFGRLFKSDKREAAFTAALAAGETRNDAMKLARRVTA